MSAAAKARKAAAMKRPFEKQPNDIGSGTPRASIRLTQGLLIAAVLVLIVIAMVQFS